MVDSDRVAGTVRNMAGKAEKAIGEGIDDKQTEASGAVREIAGTVQNAFGQAKDAVKDFQDSDIAHSARDAIEQGKDAVVGTVQERPGSALLLAGIIGFALGAILTRQPQPRRRIRRNWMYD